MTETHEVAPADASSAAPAVPMVTGNGRVDAVVCSLDALEGRPAEEHVAVFEAAHRELRDALDGSGEPARAGL